METLRAASIHGNPSSKIRFLVETLEPKTSIDVFYGNPCDKVFFVVETLSVTSILGNSTSNITFLA